LDIDKYIKKHCWIEPLGGSVSVVTKASSRIILTQTFTSCLLSMRNFCQEIKTFLRSPFDINERIVFEIFILFRSAITLPAEVCSWIGCVCADYMATK
jgi:predicted membrane chloride channel (bestrophin family)